MKEKIEMGGYAPDFALLDINANEIRLSNYRGKKIVLLSLIRGFA